MGILRTTITTFSVVTSGRITFMDKLIQKQNDFEVDMVDHLHDLVSQNRIEDACELYNEYKHYIITTNFPFEDYE